MKDKMIRDRKQAIKSFLSDNISRSEATRVLTSEASEDQFKCYVRLDEEGNNCNLYLRNGTPIAEELFWQLFRVQVKKDGEGNVKNFKVIVNEEDEESYE